MQHPSQSYGRCRHRISGPDYRGGLSHKMRGRTCRSECHRLGERRKLIAPIYAIRELRALLTLWEDPSMCRPHHPERHSTGRGGMCRPFLNGIWKRHIQKLRDAGVDVTVGVLEQACKDLIKRFVTFNLKQRPYITLKWAQSADGFIDVLRQEGMPVKLSSPITSMYVHKLRAEHQAILVGRKTALLDNPSLTVRDWYGKNPLRMVIDRELSLPSSLRLFDGSTPTWVFTSKEKASQPNLTYIRLDFGQDILPQIARTLYENKVQSLLVEGGSTLLQSFIDRGMWDEIYTEHTSAVLGEGVKAPVIPYGFPIKYTIRDKSTIGHCQN